MWDVLLACHSQVRATEGVMYGLDFPAVFTFAANYGADLQLVAEVLPFVEPAIITAWAREEKP